MKKKILILTLLLTAFVVVPAVYAAPEIETPGTIRQKIQEFKTVRTEQREQKRTEILSGAKKVVEAKIDLIIARYQKIKSRVQNMTVISAERKSELATKIDSQIANLESEKTKVEAATTAAEVRIVMAEIRTSVKNGVSVIKEVVSAIRATHLEGIVTKLTDALDKLTTKVTEIKTAGKNVASMETLETEAKAKLDTAKTKIESADFKGAKEDIVAARLKLVDLAQRVKAQIEEAE